MVSFWGYVGAFNAACAAMDVVTGHPFLAFISTAAAYLALIQEIKVDK